MESAIFRKVSLDRLSSPEQIDYLLQVTTVRGWIALLALCAALGAGLAWGLIGEMNTTVAGRGIISRPNGVDSEFAMAGGTVLDIAVKIGDTVRPGEVLAHVAQPDLVEKLKQAQSQITEAQRDRKMGMAQRADNDAAKDLAIQKQIASTQRQISDTLDQIRFAKEQVPVDEQLVAKGLITKQTAITDRQKVSSLESNVQGLQAQIAQLQANQVSMKNDTAQFALDSANKINGLIENYGMLQRALRRASSVVAHHDGRVVEIPPYPGALVSPGDPIINIEPFRGSVEVIAYVPAQKAKQIRLGMEVHVSPAGVPSEEYGYMFGTVNYVGAFPATRPAILHAFENHTVVDLMTSGGPVIEVRVRLKRNPATPSGYAWSSHQGPPRQISSGSMCSVDVVTRKQHPIALLFPYLKKTLGL
jgi:HlyD family secretion protein